MEMKQIYFDYKSMVPNYSIKRLISFVQNLEEKLSTVKLIHDKLHELMSVVSKTHDNIVEDLTKIKTILYESKFDHEDDEIIPIDATKSEWDDDDDDDDVNLQKTNQTSSGADRFMLTSASTIDSISTIENGLNSALSKRSSTLKRSEQSSSSRTKSPKSVSFSLDENLSNQQEKPFIGPIQRSHQTTKNKTFDELKSAIIPSTLLNSSKQNQNQNQTETKPKIIKTLTNIRIHEIDTTNGDYIRLLNISNSDDYDLSGHFLQQNIVSKVLCRFRFPFNTIIRAGQAVTVWCGHLKDITPQPPHVFVWKEHKKWETGPECLTTLIKPNGQSIASFRNSPLFNANQSSSDILHVHSKSNTISNNTLNTSSNTINTKQNRLSAFILPGTTKPPFAHSPDNPIHPDHGGTAINPSNDIRSQMHQSGGISQLLHRPKSSPFASHTGCKQDLISMNLLRT